MRSDDHLDLRYEYKSIVSSDADFSIESLIRTNPLGLKKAFPNRKVNNVYFDNENLETYEDNLSGYSRRIKARLRWYGESLQIHRCQLEVKNKKDQLGWKKTFPIELTIDLQSQAWPEIVRQLENALPNEGQSILQQLPKPILLNRYDRSYYVTLDGRCRLTIDRRIRHYDQKLSAQPNTQFPHPEQNITVVEFKAARDEFRRLRTLMDSFPLIIHRHSKYARTAGPDSYSL